MRHQSLLVIVAGAALLLVGSANARDGGNTPSGPAHSAPASTSAGGGPTEDLAILCIGRCPPPHRPRIEDAHRVDAHRRVEHCGLEVDGANLYYFDGGRVMRDCVPNQFSLN